MKFRLKRTGVLSHAAVAAATLVAALGGVSATTSKPMPNVQTIYVKNLSTFVSDAAVKNAIPAFQAATDKDFYPVWHVTAKIVFLPKWQPVPDGGIEFDLLNTSDIKGALAYHYVKDGVPAAKIFVGTSRYYGYSWTNGFTHEEFELLADPNIVSMAQGYDTIAWAQEVCDPVERDSQGYTRPGANGKPVLISDFVTPNWFDAAVRGPYDFKNHIQAPETILDGGYAQYWDGVQWFAVINDHGNIIQIPEGRTRDFNPPFPYFD